MAYLVAVLLRSTLGSISSSMARPLIFPSAFFIEPIGCHLLSFSLVCCFLFSFSFALCFHIQQVLISQLSCLCDWSNCSMSSSTFARLRSLAKMTVALLALDMTSSTVKLLKECTNCGQFLPHTIQTFCWHLLLGLLDVSYGILDSEPFPEVLQCPVVLIHLLHCSSHCRQLILRIISLRKCLH